MASCFDSFYLPLLFCPRCLDCFRGYKRARDMADGCRGLVRDDEEGDVEGKGLDGKLFFICLSSWSAFDV